MKAKEITVSIKQTKCPVKFEPVAVEASITLILEEGEKSTEAYEKAWASVKSEVNKQLKELCGGK